MRTVSIPRSGRDRDGRIASIVLSAVSTSPGRVGCGQLSSPPAPIAPPAIGSAPSVSSRMVIAAVCQPLATSSPKKLSRAAASSVWKGCGSNSAANALIASAVTG